MRNHALSLGYSLSEHGLKYVERRGRVLVPVTPMKVIEDARVRSAEKPSRGGGGKAAEEASSVPVTEKDIRAKIGKGKIETEEDIFKFLGLRYIDATKRKANVFATLK